MSGSDTLSKVSLANSANAECPSFPGRLDRIADLVATGELLIPDGLTPDQITTLAANVRQRRRRRLVRYIARLIANAIRSQPTPIPNDTECHAPNLARPLAAAALPPVRENEYRKAEPAKSRTAIHHN
jgi:hypothetical protein